MNRFSTILLTCIIVTGGILRFYHFFSLPFTFDELSAITRLNYETLSELIENGVKLVDTHPAGVHVFLYYWCKLFGNSEWVVKLPFLIMGIGCIYLTYLVVQNWFSQSAALVSAAFISTLQFSITYSTIARPYIPGLFFSLLMVYYWTKSLFVSCNFRNIIFFALSATLCCYIHYFSLLFAVIVGLTGLFFLKRENWKLYLLANLSVIILCLPHLGIFLYQMKRGGIGGPDGWLGPPDNDFILKFIEYIFQYSSLSVGLIVIVALFYFITTHKTAHPKRIFRAICLIWFLLPFLIGFFYSKFANPILQYSILIFSFPYLIIFICSFIIEKRRWALSMIVILVCVANIHALMYKRKHYEIMLHQPSDEFAKYIVNFQRGHPNDKLYAVLSSTKFKFMEYYKSKFGFDFDVHYFSSKDDSPSSLLDSIKLSNCDYLMTTSLPEEYNRFFRKEFPNLIYYSEGFTHDINIFSKDSTEKSFNEAILFDKMNSFDNVAPTLLWSFDPNMIKNDSLTGNNSILLDSVHEWGPGFNIPLGNIISNRTNKIVASIKIKVDKDFKDEILVLQITKGDSVVRWQGSDLAKYFVHEKDWQSIFISCNLIDVIKPGDDLNGYKLSTYFWNKGMQNVMLDDFHVISKRGNPLIYGLFEPIE